MLELRMNQPVDVLRLMRPLQWIKNGFVFTGILFSQSLQNSQLLLQVIMAAVAFSLVSSCIYIVNDIVDCESDRAHPQKKNRPLPSGKVTLSFAIPLAIVIGLLGFFLSIWTSLKVFVIILFYVLLNIAYTVRFKHVVILDVFCISAGFMLRILAGTIGVGIPPSNWLLLCGLMVTLFLGFAKRRAEIIALSDNKEEHRRVLANYGTILLDELIGICATGAIITYSLYTMSPSTIQIHKTDDLIFTVPFVIYALFRYIFLLHHGNSGGDPSRDLLRDPHIVCSVIGWAFLTFYLTFKGMG
jgi:4-hydroxybenzoate polyprenyltransferase